MLLQGANGRKMTEFDNKTMQKAALLKQKLLEIMPQPGIYKSGPGGLTMARVETPSSPRKSIYKPLALLILQGVKHSVLGTEEIVFGENQYMVTNLDIPSSCCVSEASAEKPYLALYVELDPAIIAGLLQEIGSAGIRGHNVHRAMAVADADADLIDAFLRLADLATQSVQRQKVLGPLVVREIHYRLMTGPLGGYIMTINTVGSRDNQILKAVDWIKCNYSRKINVEQLAREFCMTASTFYRNFMKVTSMSPVQYQKQMRLNEAQRLMLAKNYDAQKAAYAVGYESVTQFSKEFKRHFGKPPLSCIKNLKK